MTWATFSCPSCHRLAAKTGSGSVPTSQAKWFNIWTKNAKILFPVNNTLGCDLHLSSKKCSTATMRATICFFKNVKPEVDTARSVSKARKCQVYQWQTFRPFPCSNVDNVLGWGSDFFPFSKEYPLSVSWNASSQQIFIVLRIWRRHVIVNWFPVKISSWFIGKIIILGVATLPIFMKIWWCVERHQKNIYLKF